jgi:hypothetical protein
VIGADSRERSLRLPHFRYEFEGLTDNLCDAVVDEMLKLTHELNDLVAAPNANVEFANSTAR